MKAAARIGHVLGGRLGLIPQERWEIAVERAEAELVARHGVPLESIADELEREGARFDELAGLLSVGETFFFRHRAQFETAVRLVRSTMSARPEHERVRVWSAGCATGEEPYSLAIALHRELGEAALARVELVATDVDRTAIGRALEGRYTRWSFRDAPEWLEAGYFEPDDGGRLRLRDGAVRDAVRFEAAPLSDRVTRFVPGSLDLILFRNVAIYLHDDARAALHGAMRRALRPGGLLLQSPSDPNPQVTGFVRDRNDASHAVFVAVEVGLPGRSAEPMTLPPLRGRERRTSTPAPAPAPSPSPSPSRVPPASVEPPPSAADREVESRLVRFERVLTTAERGDLAGALQALDAELPDASTVERAKVHFAAASIDTAIELLRAAVYDARDALGARYWYAFVLHSAGRGRAALPQLRELERALAERPGSTTVDDVDGATVAELLGSVRQMLEVYA